MSIILNAQDISVTGRKWTDKIYYWHVGYIDHLKERRLMDQMEKDPTEVMRAPQSTEKSSCLECQVFLCRMFIVF